MFTSFNLSRHNIYSLFGRLKQFFSCFYRSILDTCYLGPIHAFNEQVKYCLFQLFLQCFDMFVGKKTNDVTEGAYGLDWAILFELVSSMFYSVISFFLFLSQCTACVEVGGGESSGKLKNKKKFLAHHKIIMSF